MAIFGHSGSHLVTFGHTGLQIRKFFTIVSDAFSLMMRNKKSDTVCPLKHSRVWIFFRRKYLASEKTSTSSSSSVDANVDATKNQEKNLLKHALKIFRPLSSQPNQSSSHHLSLSLSIYLNLFFFFSLSSSSIICLWFSVFTFSSLCVSLNYISFSRSN